MSELPHPFADRLALERWMERKLMRASPRVQRFMRAMADMPIEGRVKFLSVALLYSGDLAKILQEVATAPDPGDTSDPIPVYRLKEGRGT
jgi:hypothetical protein